MVDLKINVIKRDGRLKEFDYRRISDAIDKAYLEVYGHKCGIDLEDDITDEIMVLAEDNGAISVEEIQDIVVGVLMEEDSKVGEVYYTIIYDNTTITKSLQVDINKYLTRKKQKEVVCLAILQSLCKIIQNLQP